MVTALQKPSALIHQIRINKIGELSLFKFSDELQARMEQLLTFKKRAQLSREDSGAKCYR